MPHGGRRTGETDLAPDFVNLQRTRSVRQGQQRSAGARLGDVASAAGDALTQSEEERLLIAQKVANEALRRFGADRMGRLTPKARRDLVFRVAKDMGVPTGMKGQPRAWVADAVEALDSIASQVGDTPVDPGLTPAVVSLKGVSKRAGEYAQDFLSRYDPVGTLQYLTDRELAVAIDADVRSRDDVRLSKRLKDEAKRVIIKAVSSARTARIEEGGEDRPVGLTSRDFSHARAQAKADLGLKPREGAGRDIDRRADEILGDVLLKQLRGAVPGQGPVPRDAFNFGQAEDRTSSMVDITFPGGTRMRIPSEQLDVAWRTYAQMNPGGFRGFASVRLPDGDVINYSWKDIRARVEDEADAVTGPAGRGTGAFRVAEDEGAETVDAATRTRLGREASNQRLRAAIAEAQRRSGVPAQGLPVELDEEGLPVPPTPIGMNPGEVTRRQTPDQMYRPWGAAPSIELDAWGRPVYRNADNEVQPTPANPAAAAATGVNPYTGSETIVARYYTGDEWAPSNLSPEDIARRQRDLVRAGVLTTAFRIGVWDQNTAEAYATVLGFANRAGVDQDAALETFIRSTEESREAVKAAARASFVPEAVWKKPDPDRLQYNILNLYQENLGRDPDSSEMHALMLQLDADYRAVYESEVEKERQQFERELANPELDPMEKDVAAITEYLGEDQPVDPEAEAATAAAAAPIIQQEVDPEASMYMRFYEKFRDTIGNRQAVQAQQGLQQASEGSMSTFQSVFGGYRG